MSIVMNVALATTLATVGGTGMGGAIACLFRKDSSRTVSLLMSFAAGVMTAVVCFDLLSGAISAEGPERASLLRVVLGVMLGYGVIYLLNVWVDRSAGQGQPTRDQAHRRDSISPGEAIQPMHRSLLVAGMVMAAAIALHNLPEGVVIGAAFAKSGGSAAAAQGGIVMAAVIGMHDIPEGMAVAVPLISGGMSKAKAVAVTAATGVPTVLGAVLGYYLGSLGPGALSMSLSFASGAMLYVVFGELLPEAVSLWQSQLPALAAVAGIMTGMVIIYS